MELTIQDLKKDMLVKVVFYHSQMPESFFSKELGIVHTLDINNNIIIIEMLTHDFHSNKSIIITDFFIDPSQREKVVNKNIHHHRQFYRLEPCDIQELQAAQQHLMVFYEQEKKKIKELQKSLKFLTSLIKQA